MSRVLEGEDKSSQVGHSSQVRAAEGHLDPGLDHRGFGSWLCRTISESLPISLRATASGAGKQEGRGLLKMLLTKVSKASVDENNGL